MSGRGPLWAAAVAGLLVGGLGAGLGVAAVERRRQDIAALDYLVAHPDLLPEAAQRLEARAAGAAIRADGAAIRTPFAGAWAGDPHGDVTLVMFTDYACGYCRASVPAIDQLLADDPHLKVVWREIPVLGPDSEVAARLALAAARQGRFGAFHHALFAAGRPDAAHLAQAARAAGLPPEGLAAAAADPAIAREVDNNLQLAERLRIDGTPAFVVGDQLLSGAVGHDRLAAAVAAARRG